jgi:hypothetical protein
VTRAREFSVPDFERLTPDLTSAERLAVFPGLSADMQAEAWRELDRRVEAHSVELFAEHRLGGSCTAAELAAEIEYLWRHECSPVPLKGPVEPAEHASAPAAECDRAGRRGADSDLEQLRSIPSIEYVPILTGREVGPGGSVQCPLHGDGLERTPSLHVSDQDGRWYCHGCGRGGDLFDFFAAVRGDFAVPTGAGFFEFVAELAAALREGGT